MSLAKRNNGCMECRMRRVRCDKTEPQCLKCCKKGLQCSGQGIECRLSSHMTKAIPSTIPQSASNAVGVDNCRASRSRAPNRYRWVTVTNDKLGALDTAKAVPRRDPNTARPPKLLQIRSTEFRQESSHLSDVAIGSAHTDLMSDVDVEEVTRECSMELSRPQPSIEVIPSQARMLFSHFSEFIAAKMVVFDFTGNGYRNILLPLACEDDLVGRAISVIAGFHLSQTAPTLRMAAEVDQQAILSRLRRDSLQLDPNRVFSLSTWATILILLVGETITGASNYVHLLELLSFIAQSSESVQALPESTRAFIREQTRMFELFGLPLSSETKGLQMLSNSLDDFLGFMSSCPPSSHNPDNRANVQTMESAIRQACEIYRNRALNKISTEDSIQSVERLRQTVFHLEPSVDGCHALVWTYFIAAAESILPEHRAFFSQRLQSLYECTRFGTIPKAAETLSLIWANQGSRRWTEYITQQQPMLIM